MSEIYVVWATDANKAQARLLQITQGVTFQVIRQGNFELIQAEDTDNQNSLVSGETSFCIVFEVS